MSATTPRFGSRPLLREFLAGGCGGIALVLAGHPLDMVKTALQTSGIRGTSPTARSILLSTFRAGGIRGLYRGMGTPLLGVTPIFAVCFWAFSAAKDALRVGLALAPGAQLPLWAVAAAGVASAVPTVLMAAPGERVKVLVMTDARAGGVARVYRGPLDAARACLRAGGLPSLFRGSAATLARDAVGSAFYFASYEYCGRCSREYRGDAPDAPLSAVSVVAGASIAGTANWCAAMPLDVIKSRVQAGAPDAPRVSIANVARAVWSEDGARGFYRGLAPALARSVPANIAAFGAIETSRRLLEQWI